MARHAFAHDQELVEPQDTADLGAGLSTDDDRFHSRQIAFKEIGVFVKEQLANHRAQNRVPKEFKSLIRCQAMLGA